MALPRNLRGVLATRGKGIARRPLFAYTGPMEDPEDFNRFSSADCAGAILMMGAVPAVMCYVYGEHNMLMAGLIMGGFAVLALFVWALAALTRWRLIPVVVNSIGHVLAVLYLAMFFYFWPY